MTLPSERSQALRNTRRFLRSLLRAKETPGVPKEIRHQAYWCLRHFPHDYEINQVAGREEVFGLLAQEIEDYKAPAKGKKKAAT